LHAALLEHEELADASSRERTAAVRDLVASHVAGADVEGMTALLLDDIDGYGPIAPLMRDPSVADILINGPGAVWADRGTGLALTDVRFDNTPDLISFVDRLVGWAGGRIDPSNPIGDVQLKDGSRMHVVRSPIAPLGPLVSIRKFPSQPLALDDLCKGGMFDEGVAADLRELVQQRRTVLISGGTGTGKTTLLNALLGEVAPTERVVLIEETPELRPAHAHSVSLLVRHPNVEGLGEIGQDELLRAALRMRPDRIVVGEVRGSESLTVLAAMSTGHPGSMATVHASSISGSVDRMVGLAMQAPQAPSEGSLRASLEEVIDVYLHVESVGGRRSLRDMSVRC
jgi:pilus assembly protein CpaF